MKSRICKSTKILAIALAFILVLPCHEAVGVLYLSNLYVLPPQPGIGDIHNLFPGGTPYGSDTAHFGTGAGQFSVNFITLELFYDAQLGISDPHLLNLQLFQQTASGNQSLGSFANPVDDPMPTPWPQSSYPISYTKFIDFYPLQQIALNPFSQYSLLLSVGSNSPAAVGLLFTRTGVYTTPAGWTMSATSSGNPAAHFESLVMAVDATLIPEPKTTVLLSGALLLLVQGQKRRVCKPYRP